jgi:hypothetical protein
VGRVVQTRRRRAELTSEDLFRLVDIPILIRQIIACADNRETIMDDPFIRGYIDDVLRSLRTQWICDAEQKTSVVWEE